MGWSNARHGMEREVVRRVHKLAIQANTGQLTGPELESAILDLIWRVLEQNEKRGNVLEATHG